MNFIVYNAIKQIKMILTKFKKKKNNDYIILLFKGVFIALQICL